ncbi:MAG TPA: hypothetical protein VIU86_18305 [Gaiellaceae bacterium]
MQKLRTASAVAAAGVAAVLVAGSALAGTTVKKPIAFAASYSGTAAVKVADNVANISANGSGKGLLIGSGKITGTGTGDSSQQPCVPFTGPGKITGAKGTIAFTVLTGSTGCGDEGGQVFSISGKAKVTKATGTLVKATGTLKFTGTYDRGSGAFSVKFKGTLVK